MILRLDWLQLNPIVERVVFDGVALVVSKSLDYRIYAELTHMDILSPVWDSLYDDIVGLQGDVAP